MPAPNSEKKQQNVETAARRAAEILVIAEAGLAFIVISFVAQAWAGVAHAKQADAFYLIYVCGAQFAFCFLVTVPAVFLSVRIRDEFTNLSLIAALFVYLFWSLMIQHGELAGVMLDKPWHNPLTFADSMLDGATSLLGRPGALFFLPTIASYAAFGLLMVVKLTIGSAGQIASSRKTVKPKRH